MFFTAGPNLEKVDLDMRKFYNKNGYIHIKNFFTDSEIDECLNNIKKVFSNLTNQETNDKSLFNLYKNDISTYLNGCKACHNLISIYKLMLHENVIKLLKTIGVDFPAVNMKPVVMFSAKELASHNFYWKTNPHQDFSGMKSSLDGIVIWIPLFDMKKEHGFIELVPESHTKGFYNHKETGPTFEICENIDESLFKEIETEKKDIILFSAFTIHRSGRNTSNEIRYAVNFRYDNFDEKTYVERKYPQPFKYTRNECPSIDNETICEFWEKKSNY